MLLCQITDFDLFVNTAQSDHYTGQILGKKAVTVPGKGVGQFLKDMPFHVHPQAHAAAGNLISETQTDGDSGDVEVTTTYSYTDGGDTKTADAPVFTVICGSDKKVTESLYNNMGTATSGGVQCGLWKYTDGSLTVTFAIDDKLCIREYTLTDGVLSLTASLK